MHFTTISDIKEITSEYIIYYEHDHSEKMIDLLECSKNWVEHFNSHHYMTWEGDPAPKITIETNNCVGERDWFAEKPYFEFFSSPKIRFELHPKKRIRDYFNKYWRGRYHEEFGHIVAELKKAGWVTFDLG